MGLHRWLTTSALNAASPLRHTLRVQGACDSAPGPLFLNSTSLKERQCVIQSARNVLTFDGEGGHHWVENVSLQMARPARSALEEHTIADAAMKDGHIWFQHVRFVADGKVSQALRVKGGTRAYAAGAHLTPCGCAPVAS